MRPTDRPFNTAVMVLRALQVGLSLSDLDYLETGEVTNLIIERNNDGCQYRQLATQEDMDSF